MASNTSLAHCLVLINKRAALLRVTLEAGFVSTQERKAAGSKLLLNICGGALNRDAFVRFMAIAAAHLALEHRMMMRQLERCANFEVTLETSVRGLSRIDDGALSAASLDMQTSRTVAGLAPHIHGLFCSFAAAFCGTLSYN
jgi:hypothetical protein